MPIIYRKNPEWNMFIEGGRLFISRGADDIYLVDDINEEKSKKLYEAYQKNEIGSADFREEGFEKALNQLQKAGVIYMGEDGGGRSAKTVKVFFKWYGGRSREVENLLSEFARESKMVEFVADEQACELMVLARYSGKMADLMDGYNGIKKPHIFLDAAYDHNISIGPLVFPGQTACLGCAVGREIKNWGDPVPPESPAAAKKYRFIAPFVFEMLEQYSRLGSCPELIENMITFNIANFSTVTDPIFRLPWCRACYPEGELKYGGRVNIPWNI